MSIKETKAALLKLDGPSHHSRDQLLRRNGRWGTCVDCPRDTLYGVLPEKCVNTERYDHQLRRPNHEAWDELGALEHALKVVLREKALQDWESSMPTELADAIRLLQRIAKEAE